MRKRNLKVIKIAIILFIIVAYLFLFIVSQDEHHLETCNEEHCVYCAIIQVAQNIIIVSIVVVIAIMIGVLIFFFLSRLHKEQNIFMQLSLVFQKVQLNE